MRSLCVAAQFIAHRQTRAINVAATHIEGITGGLLATLPAPWRTYDPAYRCSLSFSARVLVNPTVVAISSTVDCRLNPQ